MDDEARKRLEQELRFLKESFDAEVISKEEYEKGTERIEKKLSGNNGNGDFESQDHAAEEAGPKTESKTQAKSEEASEAKEEDKPVAEEKYPKKEGKAFKYVVVFVVLTLIVFFGYSLLNQNKAAENKEAKTAQFTPICSSDKECLKNGINGVCLNAKTKSAKCDYPEKKTRVIVLNDRKNCFNCDTSRILGIAENWFGSLNASEIDYNSAQGKELADKLGINALPAYIFDSEITNKTSYAQIKQTFAGKNGNYILSENAAGSAFYFRRESMPNRLDFFAKEDASSIKAEKNLKEFLEAFPDIEFEKHSSAGDLAKELGIKTFPAFLVNNRVKFTGIHPAETIKDNFCSMNKLKECEKELSGNLV